MLTLNDMDEIDYVRTFENKILKKIISVFANSVSKKIFIFSFRQNTIFLTF